MILPPGVLMECDNSTIVGRTVDSMNRIEDYIDGHCRVRTTNYSWDSIASFHLNLDVVYNLLKDLDTIYKP